MRKMEIPRALETARRYAQAGQLQQAEKIYLEILQFNPAHAEAINQLGILYHSAGRNQDACNLFTHAIQSNPQVAAFHSNLAVALWLLGRFDEAIAAARRSIELNPRDAACWQNLGDMLQQCGDLPGAAEAFKRSIQFQENPAVHNKLLNILMILGRIDEALPIAHRAAELEPNRAAPHNNLAIVLASADKLDAAEQAYRKALALQPDDGMTYAGLGGIYIRREDYAAALDCFRQSARLETRDARPKHNLGLILLTCGYADESITWLKAAVDSPQPINDAFESLLLAMQYTDKIDPQEIFQTHQRWYERCAAPLAVLAQPHANTPDPDRRLRIGYVSPDFKRHAVGQFIEPVLASHGHEEFEVYCYSAVKQPDEVTARMSTFPDHWRPITKSNDEQVVELIRNDQVDILVDLSGHTEDNRLAVFARKPAPVQITYLGYPNTSGLPQMDYRLTDAAADPPGLTEHLYTEELVRLPDTAWCYEAWTNEPVSMLPAMRIGQVTFGSLNRPEKVTPQVAELWSRILRTVSGSRLVLSAPNGDVVKRRYIELFGAHGIEAGRLEFLDYCNFAQYVQLFNRIDVGLDPFPFNGHTTTLNALWMGVPVVTLAGKTSVSRAGVSVLTTIGLEELIARDLDEYVRKAVALVQNLTRLGELRSTMQQRMRASPLMDPERFTRNLEQIYRTLWRRWCGAR